MNIVQLMHQAAALYQSHQLTQADEVCRLILQQAEVGDAWHLRGRIAYDQGRFADAVLALSKATVLLPNVPMVHRYLGLSQRRSGDRVQAEASFRRALQLKPDYHEVLVSLGILLISLHRLDEAEGVLRESLRLKPNAPESHTNLGTVHRKRGETDQAIACHLEALRLDPHHVDVLHNLGSTYADLGKNEESLAYYERAIAIRPDFADARLSRASRWLALGDWEQGWKEYEWRWRSSELTPRPFLEPQWQGEDLHGKTILLHCEQGLGDAIQFVRYVPLVKEKGARVILECYPPLLPLFRQVTVDALVTHGDTLPDFDYHVPLMSLPGVFHTTIETVPQVIPYLQADAMLVQSWHSRLATYQGFRIGVVWKGNPRNSLDRDRSFTLRCFEAIAQLPNVTLIPLQLGAEEEMRAESARVPLATLPADFDRSSGPFMDTAAVLANVDLFITADTSLVHLAGAMGVRTWMPVALVSDWRWLLDRSDSPWYPSLQLFRQTQRGEWGPVFQRMQAELEMLLAERSLKL